MSYYLCPYKLNFRYLNMNQEGIDKLVNVGLGLTAGLCLGVAGSLITQNFNAPDHTIKIERSEEHTSELQSHSFISYAVFCLKKKKRLNSIHIPLLRTPSYTR